MENIGNSITKKRVYTLYRVSTKQQVHQTKDAEDDIPMQRTACHEFASCKDDWVIEKEFLEKGVSGKKVSAYDRDAIKDLKEAALNDEFDVLLLWKFDRLGRIEEETPFVLKWFVEKGGVEVWSTIEGQRKFENSMDKLLNYLTFWQADVESENTSIRIRERKRQLKAEGAFMGGIVPYGYKKVNKGRFNKKGQEVPDLEVDEEAAFIIQEHMFKLLHDSGYGAYKITQHLREKGIKASGGKPFTPATVKRILENSRYRGEVVDADIFDKVQRILETRSKKRLGEKQTCLSSRGNVLLSGFVYCGHCGTKMSVRNEGGRWTTKDGTQKRNFHYKYCCHHNCNLMERTSTRCDGQSVYTASRIDDCVEAEIQKLFSNLMDSPKETALKAKSEQRIKYLRDHLKSLEAEKTDATQKLAAYEDEIGNSLLGTSKFSPDILSKQIGC